MFWGNKTNKEKDLFWELIFRFRFLREICFFVGSLEMVGEKIKKEEGEKKKKEFYPPSQRTVNLELEPAEGF